MCPLSTCVLTYVFSYGDIAIPSATFNSMFFKSNLHVSDFWEPNETLFTDFTARNMSEHVFYFISNSIFGFRLELLRVFHVFILKVAFDKIRNRKTPDTDSIFTFISLHFSVVVQVENDYLVLWLCVPETTTFSFNPFRAHHGHITVWKVSVSGVFLVRIFLHSDWIRRDTLRIQSKCGKIRARKTPNTDTFHAVLVTTYSQYFLVFCNKYCRIPESTQIKGNMNIVWIKCTSALMLNIFFL